MSGQFATDHVVASTLLPGTKYNYLRYNYKCMEFKYQGTSTSTSTSTFNCPEVNQEQHSLHFGNLVPKFSVTCL